MDIPNVVVALAASEAALGPQALIAFTMIQHRSAERLSRVVERLDEEMARIRQDKRGGSKVGRRKRLRRLPCRWREQYFGDIEDLPVYNDSHFRNMFGIPKHIYSRILDSVGPVLYRRPACDGTPAHGPDLQLLTTLRILRTGCPCSQFDAQTGMGLSTIRENFRFVSIS